MYAKKIVLGVCGGIAAYKAAIILRLLIKAGHDVTVIPTANSLHMVGKTTWQALSGKPVHTSVFDADSAVEHTTLAASADLVIVAPATADFLARYRQGRADDLLGAVLLATTAPVLVAPAMHTAMWMHPATVENVSVLRSRGVKVMEPATGALTGSDIGQGRLPEPEEIVEAALALFETGSLSGKRVVISGGGTREYIDPVRFIGNESSGRQALALAEEAARRGAEVTLVAANIEDGLIPSTLPVVKVVTTAQLESQMKELSSQSDVVIMCAAVADYRVDNPSDEKLRKEQNGQSLTLRLTQNPDILAGLVAARRPGQVIVAFAAHTGQVSKVIAEGAQKAVSKGADLMAVNRVGYQVGFGDRPNEIFILDQHGKQVGHGQGSKVDTARALIDEIERLLS